MRLFWRRGAGPTEPGLEQRLETLEDAVQGLTDALWAMRSLAATSDDADLPGRCRELLDGLVPAGERVVLVADPTDLSFVALRRPADALQPAADGSAAAVARLEAKRALGVRFLLVPEASRPDLEQDALLVEHLGTHFRAIGEEPEIGVVFEMLAQKADDAEEPALGVLIEGLELGDRLAPMLDWTTDGLAHLIPGRTVFRPVEPDGRELPYLERSIDVVLVDDAERMDEAARVAARAVVRVAPGEAGGTVVVETRRLRSERHPDHAAVPILVATDAGDEWLASLTEALADRPGTEVRAAVDPLAAAVETDAPIVVLAERGILPLPGCIEAAERLLAQDDELGGVAVKLFDADGSLEAAGGATFEDGSVEGIAGGAAGAAPWHEYVRPVAAAVGLVVLRGAAARQIAPANGAGSFDLTGLCAHLRSSGWKLCYQPDAAAVRVLPVPGRPVERDDESWRRLLTRDKVGAAR